MSWDQGTSKRITIDDDGYVRVWDKGKFDDSVELSRLCHEYGIKVSEFQDLIKRSMEMIEERAKAINEQKKISLGFRLMEGREIETRARKKAELEALMQQKQAELDRLVTEYESLQRIDAQLKEQMEWALE